MRRSAVLVAAALVAGSLPLAAQLPEWITVDTAAKTVALAFDVEPGGPDGIATLNGHHHGDVQLVVPLNWTVRWTWTHRDSTQNHSLVVMAEREKLPLEGGRPALENAMTRAVLALPWPLAMAFSPSPSTSSISPAQDRRSERMSHL